MKYTRKIWICSFVFLVFTGISLQAQNKQEEEPIRSSSAVIPDGDLYQIIDTIFYKNRYSINYYSKVDSASLNERYVSVIANTYDAKAQLYSRIVSLDANIKSLLAEAKSLLGTSFDYERSINMKLDSVYQGNWVLVNQKDQKTQLEFKGRNGYIQNGSELLYTIVAESPRNIKLQKVGSLNTITMFLKSNKNNLPVYTGYSQGSSFTFRKLKQ